MRHHHEMRFEHERGWFGHEGGRADVAMGGDHGRRGYGWRRGGGHGEDEQGEGRGRRRMFDGGELRLVMLLLMEAEPRHGYDMIREIETRTSGAYAPSPGVVYPTLTLLEELAQVKTVTSEGAKKLFAITPVGLAHLNANRADAETALARLDALGSREKAFDAGPVFRAMSNLKTALRQRLGDPTDKQLMLSVADAIDEAARKIERL